MQHIRAIQRFAKSLLFWYNDAIKSFISDGSVKCSLQVYDRFISDRTFGTKKRILLVPGPQRIPEAVEYVRVGPSMARYMLDAIDEDLYAQEPHLTCYLIREAAYPVEILRMDGSTRASGRSGPATLTVVDSVTRWGDYERYTASTGKQDMEEVSNSIIDVFLPLSAPVTSDNYIAIDNKVIQVREVYRVSNLLVARGVKQDIDYSPSTNQRAYSCDPTIDISRSVPELLINDTTVTTLAWKSEGMCQSLFIAMNGEPELYGVRVYGVQGDFDYPDDYAGVKLRLTLYNGYGEVIATSTTGRLAITLGTPQNYFFLSAAPQVYSPKFDEVINVIGSVPA